MFSTVDAPFLREEMAEKLPESAHADCRYHPKIGFLAIFPKSLKP